MTAAAPQAWADARLVAALFAIDPAGLGGVVVRSGPGPVRDAWLALARGYAPPEAPWGRIPVHIQDDRLLGGLDLPASLAAGRPVIARGVLAQSDGGVALLAMAERLDDGVAARLTAVLDTGEVVLARDGVERRDPARIGLIALDEGAAPDERAPDALADRLAFHLDLDAVGLRDVGPDEPDPNRIADARRALCVAGPTPAQIVDALCEAAQDLGVGSLRAPLFAVRVARVHAAWRGRSEATAEDAAVAARLVLVPRAVAGAGAPRQVPDQPPEPAPSPDDSAPASAEAGEPARATQADQVVAAVQAVLPDGLHVGAPSPRRRLRAAGGQGAGEAAPSALRGRPLSARPGRPGSGKRLHLVETLRAAAPWQKLRARDGDPARLRVRTEDLRVRRFLNRREATTIFVVDASGSSAFQRLAETKGAVELLLAKAYVKRTRVALVAFRNTKADVLLAPTRSLTRAKRQLADLVGGGGTPLAAGLDAAVGLALAEQARSRTPTLVVLTDGRANVARDGSLGRAQAESDALAAARRVREQGLSSAFIDTSPRPRPDADRFAQAMGAAYRPLPYSDAGRLYGLVDGLGAGRA